MLELDVVHKRGPRTFAYTALTYGWWLSMLGIMSGYLAYSIYMGPLMERTTTFLAGHQDWYVEKDALALWLALVALSFFLVAYLRTNVIFRMYKFTLDEHAFRLQRGLFRIREITFPYNQISNVNIEQPYHYRMLGLAQLDIISSSDNSSTRKKKKQNAYLIPLIDKSIAKELRLQLMRYGSGKGSPYDDMDDAYDDDEYDDDGDDDTDDNTEESYYSEEEYLEISAKPNHTKRL